MKKKVQSNIFARIRHAWRCLHCNNFTLEFRGARVVHCPNCGGHDWEAERFTVYLPTQEAVERK